MTCTVHQGTTSTINTGIGCRGAGVGGLVGGLGEAAAPIINIRSRGTASLTYFEAMHK